MNNKVTLRLYGRVELSSGTERLASFKTNSVRALLVLLALEPGKEFDRRWLQDHLWPDSRQEARGNRLSVTLYQLKADLARFDPGLGQALKASRTTVWLEPGTLETDYEELAVLAASKPSSHEEAVSAARTALSIYRGPLAPGISLSEANQARLQSARRLAGLCQRAADALVIDGDTSAAMDVMEDLAKADPSSATVIECLESWWRAKGDFERADHFAKDLAELRQSVGPRAVVSAPPMAGSVPDVVEMSRPTLTLVMVSSEHTARLTDACAGLPVEAPMAGQSFVLAPNPLTARVLADRVRKMDGRAKVLIALQVMHPHEQPSKAIRGYHRQMPTGEVWLTRPTAHVLQDYSSDVVMERTSYATYVRIS